MQTTQEKFMVRQGDVLVFSGERPRGEWEEAPRDALGRAVLAYGTATGHSHAIASKAVKLLKAKGVGDAVLVAVESVDLTHDEHSTISIPAGEYLVRIQRQWDGATSNQVED